MLETTYFDSMVGMRQGKPWVTNVVLSLIGVVLVLMARQFVLESDVFFMGFSGVSGWSVWFYVAAVAVVMTQPVDKATLWIVLGFAAVMRGFTVFADPFSSSDIYRYVWDGVVQHAHINPYRYVPGDAALTFLRAPHMDLFNNINRRDYAHTIYPPVAQMIYYVVTFFSQTARGMKIAMFGFECVTAGALVVLLRKMGRCGAEVLLYAWCPLLVWEIGDGGHVDAAIMAFVTLAILSRYCGSRVWTGVFLGAAVLTKFYPLVLFPALWQRRDWKMPGVMMAMTAAGYAVYSSVGMGVFGFFQGYEKEEGMSTGSRYFALDLAHQFRGLEWVGLREFNGLCVLVMGGLCWWAWKKASVEVCGGTKESRSFPFGKHRVRMTSHKVPEFMRVAMCLALALMLLFSPHYPWYIAWLIPFLALVPNFGLLAYVMAFFYLFTTALADGTQEKMLIVNKWLYGAALIGCLLQWAWSRWNVGRWFVLERFEV